MIYRWYRYVVGFYIELTVLVRKDFACSWASLPWWFASSLAPSPHQTPRGSPPGWICGRSMPIVSMSCGTASLVHPMVPSSPSPAFPCFTSWPQHPSPRSRRSRRSRRTPRHESRFQRREKDADFALDLTSIVHWSPCCESLDLAPLNIPKTIISNPLHPNHGNRHGPCMVHWGHCLHFEGSSLEAAAFLSLTQFVDAFVLISIPMVSIFVKFTFLLVIESVAKRRDSRGALQTDIDVGGDFNPDDVPTEEELKQNFSGDWLFTWKPQLVTWFRQILNDIGTTCCRHVAYSKILILP